MKYSITKGVIKALKIVVLFAIPVLIDAFIIQYPEYAQLSLGGLLVLAWNYLKISDVPIFKNI